MRTRLITVLGVLFVVSILGLSVALALSFSTSRTRDFVLERSRDLDYVSRLAEAATPASGYDELLTYVRRYSDLYGDTVLVTDNRGIVVASAGGDPADARILAAVESALRSEESTPLVEVLPWGPTDAVFTYPIGRLSDPSGVVVIEASTAPLRAELSRLWTAVAAVSLVMIALFMGGAVLVSRWVMRPLEKMTNDLAELSARLPGPRRVADNAEDTAGGTPEFRRLRRSFDDLSATVVDAVATQQRITADAAHQLRNPLAALQLRLDSIALAAPDGVRGELERAATEVERLSSLLDGMLTLAELEHAALTADAAANAACDVDDVIVDRVDAWQQSFVRAGIDLRISPDNEPVVAAISSDALAQILDVALSNASRYAGAGAVVTLATSRVDDEAIVEVIDSGVGVASESAHTLTQRFVRGASGGSGLGLSIADALADIRGGSVTMVPTKPHGATFRLTVPVSAKVSTRT